MGIKNTPDSEMQGEFETSPTSETPLTTQYRIKEGKEKNSPTSFYITDRHRKALKMKIALSDKPEDKDFSSIVRKALDIYLADVLETI